MPDLTPGARVLLADIADESRKALDELRGVLGILRRADGETGRAPQPGAADIAALVADAAAIGDATLVGAEHLSVLDPTAGYVGYRVVQEALTNARRHAPGAAVRVEVGPADLEPADLEPGDAEPGDAGLRIRVLNRADGVDAVTPGRGLTGMRERVEAVGGRLLVEPRGGDLLVEAILPTSETGARPLAGQAP